MVTVAVGMLTILAAIIWHKDDGHGIHEIIGVTIVGAAIPGVSNFSRAKFVDTW